MGEEFTSLLEEYLDEDMIRMKREEDEALLGSESEKEGKHASPFGIENTISIDEYATHYLGLPGNYEMMLHCGLKDLKCPYVVGLDNRFANKNPELVYKGFLLLVMDYKRRRGTYVNPIYLKRVVTRLDEKALEVMERVRVHDFLKAQFLYQQYCCLEEQIKKNQAFMDLLKRLHKMEKVEELQRLEELELNLRRKKS